MRRPGSIRLRLVLAGAAAIALALALAAGGLALLFDRHVERVARADLEARALALAAGLEAGPDGRPVLAAPPADPRYARPLSGHYWQIALEGEVLRSRSLWDHVLALPEPAPEPGAARLLTLPGPRDESLLVLDRSLRLGTGAQAPRIRLSLAADRAELTAARRDFLGDLAPFLGLLGLALVAASAVQVTVGLRPLRAAQARVADLGAGRRRRMGGGLPAEVMPLAAEIDALLDARAAELERARLRAGDLAHGLKTPLQALEGDAAQLRARGQDDIAASIGTVVTAMRRHVEHELARARMQHDHAHAEADPAEILRKVVAVLRRTPRGAELDWRIDAGPGLRARIDPADLTEMLGALAENAMRHAARAVEITVTAEGARLRLSLCDDGPGVPEAELPHLTRRGTRLDESGPGHGIGLAIVADIVAAAGGELRLANADPGFLAEILLPRAGN